MDFDIDVNDLFSEIDNSEEDLVNPDDLLREMENQGTRKKRKVSRRKLTHSHSQKRITNHGTRKFTIQTLSDAGGATHRNDADNGAQECTEHKLLLPSEWEEVRSIQWHAQWPDSEQQPADPSSIKRLREQPASGAAATFTAGCVVQSVIINVNSTQF